MLHRVVQHMRPCKFWYFPKGSEHINQILLTYSRSAPLSIAQVDPAARNCIAQNNCVMAYEPLDTSCDNMTTAAWNYKRPIPCNYEKGAFTFTGTCGGDKQCYGGWLLF